MPEPDRDREPLRGFSQFSGTAPVNRLGSHPAHGGRPFQALRQASPTLSGLPHSSYGQYLAYPALLLAGHRGSRSTSQHAGYGRQTAANSQFCGTSVCIMFLTATGLRTLKVQTPPINLRLSVHARVTVISSRYLARIYPAEIR